MIKKMLWTGYLRWTSLMWSQSESTETDLALGLRNSDRSRPATAITAITQCSLACLIARRERERKSCSRMNLVITSFIQEYCTAQSKLKIGKTYFQMKHIFDFQNLIRSVWEAWLFGNLRSLTKHIWKYWVWLKKNWGKLIAVWVTII